MGNSKVDEIAHMWFEVDDLRKQALVFAAEARHETKVMEEMLMVQSHLGHALTHLKWARDKQEQADAKETS